MLTKIGQWKISIIETGRFWLDGGAMMGNVPKVLWNKTNPSDKYNRIELALRCLLLDNGQKRVLIETGLGGKINSKFVDMFNIKQSSDPLKDALNTKNYNVEDITDVILTHLHFDHAGGATTFDKLNNIVPTFPNAVYYVSESNWELGNNPNPRDKASYLNENYIPLKKFDQLCLVPDNSKIMDDISTIIVDGHTFGQQLIKIDGDNETLIFCSDLIPLKSHIKIPWIMGYDLNAYLTLQEKTTFLKEACNKKWWLYLYHDPKIVALQIEKGEKYYNIINEIESIE